MSYIVEFGGAEPSFVADGERDGYVTPWARGLEAAREIVGERRDTA